MNTLSMILEIATVLLGIAILLADLWIPREQKKWLHYGGLMGAAFIFAASLFFRTSHPLMAMSDLYVLDDFSLLYKRLFLGVALIVMIMGTVSRSERFIGARSEFQAMVLFATSGMMFASSANHMCLFFVAIELTAIPFYALIGFERDQRASLEASIKYLVLAGLAAAFLLMGIAFVYGTTGTMSLSTLANLPVDHTMAPLFYAGCILIITGLGFKIAAFPFQVWSPDVYQGAPTPTTALLAAGSKAAGFVVLFRFFQSITHVNFAYFTWIWTILALASVAYGCLCAIPQTNVKRLLGYSSIVNSGYVLLGLVAGTKAGMVASTFYLTGYVISTMVALFVIHQLEHNAESVDLESLHGLHRRSPFLAAILTLSMASLAGIPPMVGFAGKFLLLKSVLETGALHPINYLLVALILTGIIVSIYYYFKVIKAAYWTESDGQDNSPIHVGLLEKITLLACAGFILVHGIYPSWLYQSSLQAASVWTWAP